jgi:cyclopropane fatty-acyl-phospholipid synthase-like methyltransferase
MPRANNPFIDYRELVRTGYDTCAAAYTAERQHQVHPELSLVTTRLPDGAHVLDLGCGGGVPIAKTLATRFQVTGVDISPAQIRLAQRHVPTGTFVCADIMAANFAPALFDAVVAFYAIFHLPQEMHPDLFRRIYQWLKPGGYLLATVASHQEDAYTENDFFGVDMYWSNLGFDDYLNLLRTTGFTVLDQTVLGHGYTDAGAHAAESHPLIFAQKTDMEQEK